MNIFDTYDNIVENIQQIPLDVYLFIRRNSRLNAKLSKMKKRHTKIIKKMLNLKPIDLENLKVLSAKIIKMKKKLVDSAIILQKIIRNIYDKTNQILSNENENILHPSISIDNINRIIKVGKLKDHGPNYCICKQKAFDNMIACDNTKCSIKWFHFECAGITLPPKNVWFCTECRKMKDVK